MFTDPKYGADGSEDERLVWQEPLRKDEPGQWGAPLMFQGDEFAGHAALRSRCHAGYKSVCMRPPDQDGNLDRWLIGVDPASGTRVGPILALGPHQITSSGKIRDENAYADGRLVVADAAAGWDQHGLWVSGKIRPGATEHQKAALYGSALSGEWLPSDDQTRLELVAMLAVNAPGYVVRRLAASVGFTVGPVCCPDELSEDHPLTALAAALLYGLE